jgi:hypothetical protein
VNTKTAAYVQGLAYVLAIMSVGVPTLVTMMLLAVDSPFAVLYYILVLPVFVFSLVTGAFGLADYLQNELNLREQRARNLQKEEV